MVTQLLQSVLEAFLGRNSGPGYRIAVTDVADDRSKLAVTLSFVAGRLYCCAESFCHVPHDPSSLVRFAADSGLVLPANVEIHWSFVVEEGALLACNKSFGVSLASKRYEYTAVSRSKLAG